MFSGFSLGLLKRWGEVSPVPSSNAMDTNATGVRICLMTHNGKFLSCNKNYVKQAELPGATATFFLQIVDNNLFTLKTWKHKYLCAEKNGSVVGNRETALEWERWEILPTGEGKIAIRSHHGKFLCAEDLIHGGAVVANRGSADEWEWFTIMLAPDQKIGIASNGSYLAQSPSGIDLTTCFDFMQPNCHWITEIHNGYNAFVASNGMYLSCDAAAGFRTSNNAVTFQEQFRVHLIAEMPQFSFSFQANKKFLAVMDQQVVAKDAADFSTRMFIHKLHDVPFKQTTPDAVSVMANEGSTNYGHEEAFLSAPLSHNADSSPRMLTSITVYQTCQHTNEKLSKRPDIYFRTHHNKSIYPIVSLHRDIKHQTIIGFGAAFTESASYNWSLLSERPDLQDELIDAYFGPNGLNYSLCRVHMNSCDFSLGNYSCCDTPNDYSLKTFNIERDKKYIIPMIKAALKRRSFNLFFSPWSPPAWMKSNGQMNSSNKPNFFTPNNRGLIDRPDIYNAWATHFVKFVDFYRKEGIEFWGCSIQNEPEYAAPWDEQMRDFLKSYLGPILKNAHPHMKIMIYDHNRDNIEQWVKTIFGDPEAAKYADGTAFHWYKPNILVTEDAQFAYLQSAHNMFPDKFMINSEACHEKGPKFNDWTRGEAYGKDIIRDLNSFAAGWVDWNMTLDMKGGPNHVGNFCDALILVDKHAPKLHYQVMYYYMGHFSKFLPPGSVRVHWSLTGSKPYPVEIATFITPHNETVLIAMNFGDQPYDFLLQDNDIQGATAHVTVPPHSIKTLVYNTK